MITISHLELKKASIRETSHLPQDIERGKDELAQKLEMKKCLSTHDVETTTDIQNLFQSIGVIKSSWYSPTSQLEAISYGSACLIANNIVLTCAHNVFNENRGQFCTEAVFFPNVDREALSLSKGYPSQKGKFYQCLPPIQTFSIRPIQGEICLLILKDKLKLDKYIPIGNLSDPFPQIQKTLTVIGYPSQNYYYEKDLERVKPKRTVATGKILSCYGNIVNYSCSTKKGMSGGPLLCKEGGSWKIIGVHTHRGLNEGYNSGVYFTADSLNLIKTFQGNFVNRFSLGSKITFLNESTNKKSLQQQDTNESEQQDQYSNVSPEENWDLKSCSSSDISIRQQYFQSQSLMVDKWEKSNDSTEQQSVLRYQKFYKELQSLEGEVEEKDCMAQIFDSEDYEDGYQSTLSFYIRELQIQAELEKE